MKTYNLTIVGYNSGLNEVLNGRMYDFRCRKYRNPVKQENDKICCNGIRFAKELRGVHIHEPIIIHYKFYVANKRRDRMNVASAFDKSFEDALQLCQVIHNDGWDDVYGATYEFHIDKNNPRVEICIEEVKKEI